MYYVNWATKVISIPYAATTFVSASPNVRSLDITDMWATLRSIEDDPEGMTYPQIVRNTTPLTVAGVTLARVVEIINGYTLEFEDGLYAVNIIGGNSNVSDVVNKNQVSVNTANSTGLVQVAGGSGDPWATTLPGPYAPGTAGAHLGGLPPAVANVATAVDGIAVGVDGVALDLGIVANEVADIATAVSSIPADVLDTPVESGVTLRQAMRVMMSVLAGKVTGAAGPVTTFRDVNDTKDRVTATVDGNGNRTAITIDST